MEDIRIYDFDFNLLHIEHNIKSAYWTLCFNDIGTFEGTFPLSSPVVRVLFENQYLFLTQGNLQAIITGKTADTAVTVYGKTPNWILSRRAIGPFKTSELDSENYDDVVEYILKTAFSDIYDSDFTFANLAALETHSDHFWRNTKNPVSDVIRDRLDNCLLGHRVVLDIKNKKWNFEIYDGVERPYVVSEANRNLKNVSLSEDIQDFYTAGWYKKELKDMGALNPAAESLPQNSPAAYGSYYTFEYEEDDKTLKSCPAGAYYVCVDKVTGKWQMCRELPELWDYLPGTADGIYRWDAVLSSASESEAAGDLQNKKRKRQIAGESSRIKLGTDFQLGDTVRVQVEKGGYTETVSKRITGAEVWWENGNIGEKMIFKEEE